MMQQRIYFNSRDKLIRLDTQKIVYFEGDGNYTYIVTANKQKVCITLNLAHTEDALAAQLGDNAKRFMRIGKRFIVNMNYIYQVDLQKQVLLLSDWSQFVFQLPISKEALKAVKEIIVKINNDSKQLFLKDHCYFLNGYKQKSKNYIK
jgi:DNA-binding LytR/AlgR family response regulator